MRTHRTFVRAGLLVTATVAATAAATATGSLLVPGHGLSALAGTAPTVTRTTVKAEPGGRSAGREERGRQEHGASAYGLAATGPVPIAPVPAVSSVSSEVRRTVLRENSTRHLSAKALDTGASANRADATVTDLRVPTAGLTADAITARCGAGKASSHLTNARIAGQRLASEPRPNTTIPVEIPGAGPAWVTLNKQERLPDGRLSVTGMETAVPLGPLGRETFRTANAICGRGASAPSHKGGKAKTPRGDQVKGRPAAPAPRPSPVKGNLPVTG